MVDQPQPVTADRIEMRAARDQHDLVPAGGKLGSDDRADRSGADDGDSHAGRVYARNASSMRRLSQPGTSISTKE